MVSPMMALPAPGDPSYEPAPPEEPEPEPRCLCGSMSLTSGAITVGVIEMVLYFFCTVVALFYGFRIGAFDHQAALGALLTLGIHITFNSLLVHGARTGCYCMVLSWTIYQGVSKGALIYFFVIAFGIIDDDGRLRHIGLIVGFAALLALELWFFAVGVLLSQWLSRKRGVVIRVRQPLGAPAGQPQYQPQCPPQCPPQYPPQYLPQQNQPHPQQYHPQQPQGNLQQPQQYQHQPQQPGTGPDAPPPYDIVEKSSAIR